MKRISLCKIFLFSGCLLLSSILSNESCAQAPANSIMLSVDHKNLVSRADLVYDKPVSRSEEGMPVGNGVMGSLVWTTPSSLRFQLNRVDVFANNSASNNFYERHTDYCGGIGFVDIDFINAGDAVFAGQDFRQHLSCYNGLVTVNGNGGRAKVLAWNEQDVMAVQVEDQPEKSVVQVSLRALRTPVTKKGNHTALSSLKVVNNTIVLTQEFREDDYYCGSAVVIGIVGRDGKAELANESAVRLIAGEGSGEFTFLMASASSFDPKEDIVALATKKLEAAKSKGFSGMLQSNDDWWQSFWEKSFIHLSSADGVADMIEKHYTYYLYVMASSSRGKYPPKFNGMLWTTGGDDRKWGNLYWGANQSCLYNALFPTNRVELMDPMFSMYSAMYNACAVASQQEWGSKGIYIPETVAFDGMVPLPDDIATEMRSLYLLQKPWAERSQKFYDYAFAKMPFLSRWNWKKDEGWTEGEWHTSDKGGGAFGHVTHIFSRGAKIAYQYWLKYEYTQDKEWLRTRAYPMLKGVAEFYRNFPNIKKEKDGKYHIYHVNDNESVWGGHNTVEEISSMMGIFPAVIKASELLGVDADMRPVWKEFVENLSPLPLSTDHPGFGKGATTWARALPPIVQGNGSRMPDPNTMPVWFFDLCNLESDPGMLTIANATYDAYFQKGINTSTPVYVLSKLAVAGAQLGREEATRYLIPNQLRTAEIEVMANRMDLREGFQTTSVQRLGRAADALHYALCQSAPHSPGEDPVIRVFAAWPREWNATYSLLCRGRFVVTSSLQKGRIEFVEVVSQAGSDCRIRNPWPGQEVTLYRNGKKMKSSTADLLTFSTRKNDRFVLVARGDRPDQFKHSIPGQ
jgi:hypothetical protein